MKRIACGFAIWLSLARPAAAAPCGPAPEVRAKLRVIDDKIDPDLDPTVSGRARVAALRSLLDAYPGDLAVLEALREVQLDQLDDAEAFRAELTKARQRGLDEASALYLESELTVPDKKAQEAKLRQVLGRDPKHVRAHLELARLLRQTKRAGEARTETLRVIDLCPDLPEGYELLARSGELKALGPKLKALRVRLDRATDPDTLETYSTLWELAFRVAPPTAAPALITRVAADLVRLRKLAGDRATEQMLDLLAKGYKTATDEAGQKWVVAERARLYPASHGALADAEEAWRDGPGKERAKTLDGRHAQAQQYLALTRQWVKRWPGFIGAWQNQLSALRGVPQPPIPELEVAMAQLRKLGSSDWVDVAEASLRYGIHVAEAPALLQRALQDAELQARHMRRAFDDKPEALADVERQLRWQKSNALSLLALVELKLGHRDRAAHVTAQLAQNLPTLPADADEDQVSERRDLEATLEHVHGHLALADNKPADALAHFLREVSLDKPAKDPPEPGEDDVRTDLEQTWKALGGAPATLALLPRGEAKAESGGEWKSVTRQMPSFSLQDLTGKRWTLHDLRGKVAVINAWATWCGPCNEELPDVIALHAKLAGRKDVVLLSFNLDEDLGPVGPFVKQHEIRFPVLIATGHDELVPKGSIPYTFIVDRRGQVRSERSGIDPDAQPGQWVEAAMKAIEAAR